MYFFHCEETRPLVSIFTYIDAVSIFTYIDAMLLNLEAPVPQQTKRKFVNLSVLKNFIKFQNF
jgi:hypothetical protein